MGNDAETNIITLTGLIRIYDRISKITLSRNVIQIHNNPYFEVIIPHISHIVKPYIKKKQKIKAKEK